MARLTSLLKVEGTIDGMTVVKTKDGYIARKKGGISKHRIRTDAAFKRTRENGAEFGHCAKMGKLFRRAVLEMLKHAKDDRVTSRVTKVMSDVKNQDPTSPRGKRKVALGLATPEGKEYLKGFSFNIDASLESVLLKDVALDTATGEMTIDNLIPSTDLQSPEGATHVSLVSGFLNLDFSNNVKDFQQSPATVLPLDMNPSTVTLTPAAVPVGTGTQFYLLLVSFYQEITGTQYPLNNGAYNAMSVLEVL